MRIVRSSRRCAALCAPRHQRAAVALSAGITLAPVMAHAQPEAASRIGQDIFISGAEIRVDDEVTGDAILLGGTLDVAAVVHGDGVFGGQTLSLHGPFGSDLYAVGERVLLDGDVARNVRIAGRDVTFGANAAVAGGAGIAASRAEVAGSIGSYLLVGANSTLLSAHVAGDVDVSGTELVVTPEAEVDGHLLFRGPEPPRVVAGARIHGGVMHIPDGAEATPWAQLRDVFPFSALTALGIGAVGLLTQRLWPRWSRPIIVIATGRPSRALLVGLAVTIGGPIAVMLLAFSLVGLPLALVAACAYLVSFPLGSALAAAGIAERLLERVLPTRAGSAGWRALALLLTLLALQSLAFLPGVGPLFIALPTLVGVGALALASAGSVQLRPAARADSLSSGAALAASDDASILM